jgi:hypothetical protein
MDEEAHRKDSADAGTAVSLRPANPDGKSANGFLLDWYASAPRGVVAKPRNQVLAELFTSLLVLSAKFRYKPAVGVTNYLYLVEGEWVLSLIAPGEWSEDRAEAFAGTCVLQADRTWTIAPSEQLAGDTPVAQAVARFYEAFAAALDTDGVLEDVLPFYAGHLAYYQRLNANALSRSIRATVTLGDQREIPAREWRLALPETGPIRLLRQD